MSDYEAITPTEEDVEAAKALIAEIEGKAPASDDKPTDDDKPADDKPADESDGKTDETEDDGKKPEAEDLEIKPKDSDDESKDETKDDDDPNAELIDINDFSEEFDSPDGPSEETMEKLIGALESAKIANAKELIEEFVELRGLKAQQGKQAGFDMVGGADEYQSMVEWAAENLDADDIADFNHAIKDPRTAKLAIKGLHADYKAANQSSDTPKNPQTRSRVAAGGNVRRGLEPVETIEQIAELTADPRYDRDPAFRAEVAERVRLGHKG